jgi:CheY-like chemotaxis protein
MRSKVLLIEPQQIIATNIQKTLDNCHITAVSSAADGIVASSNERFDVVIIELSLGGHSGMEFLYEFRSYADWQDVPIVVFSSIKVSEKVLQSRSWNALRVTEYLYKPVASLKDLKQAVEKQLVAA